MRRSHDVWCLCQHYHCPIYRLCERGSARKQSSTDLHLILFPLVSIWCGMDIEAGIDIDIRQWYTLVDSHGHRDAVWISKGGINAESLKQVCHWVVTCHKSHAAVTHFMFPIISKLYVTFYGWIIVSMNENCILCGNSRLYLHLKTLLAWYTPQELFSQCDSIWTSENLIFGEDNSWKCRRTPERLFEDYESVILYFYTLTVLKKACRLSSSWRLSNLLHEIVDGGTYLAGVGCEREFFKVYHSGGFGQL